MNDTNASPAAAQQSFTAPPFPDDAALVSRFAGVSAWIFDLDNTLYPPEADLFGQIERRMTRYVSQLLSVTPDAADQIRTQYWREHGTTLAGLMANYDIDPHAYLADVHDIDFSVLTPDPALAAAIAALPGIKIVHTNADASYAGRVLAHRGLDSFEALYGIEETGFHPKPDPRAYAAVLTAHGIAPHSAAFFEDDPRNLNVPHMLGMRTVLVGPGRNGPDAVDPTAAPGAHINFQTGELTGFVTALARALAAVAR